MPDRDTLQEVLNKAGKAYKAFLEREGDGQFFTEKQKKERKRTFLETHVGLFGEYLANDQTRRANWNRLTSDAKDLGRAVAREFPKFRTDKAAKPAGSTGNKARVKNRKEEPKEDKNLIEDDNLIRNDDLNVARIIEKDEYKDQGVGDNLLKEQGEIDLQGEAFQNYRNRTDRNEVTNGTVLEGSIQETESQKALKTGITDAQKKGMREICAYLYRSTKKHQKLVDGIAGRTPREKLLMFYIIENDKRHNVTQQDIFESQHYVPSLENFEKKIWFRKHLYKLGGKNINWDMIADASATAFQSQGLLGIIGMSDAKIQNQKDNDQDILKDDSKENLINIDTSAHKEEGEKKEEKKEENLLIMDEEPPVEEVDPEEIIKEAEKRIGEIEAISRELSQVQNENLIRQERLNELQEKISALNEYARKNSVLLNMALGKNVEHAKGDTGAIKLNTRVQKLGKWLGVVQGFCSSANSVFTVANANYQNPVWSQMGSDYGGKAGVGADSIMTFVNLLATVANFMSAYKSFSSGAWEDITAKSITALLSLANTGKSGLTATRTIATMAANADWGIKGTSHVANVMKSGTAIGGIAIGGVTAGMGIYNISTGAFRKSLTTDVETYLNNKGQRIDNNLGKRQNKAQTAEEKGKNQILKNIISANRSAANRTQLSGTLQMIQGGLNAASGYVAMTVGVTAGITSFVSAGLSGLALLVGIGNIIYQNKKKKKEAAEIVDCYINMDSLYANYLETRRRK